MKSKLATFIYAVLAGMCISLGGTIFLVSLGEGFPGGKVVGVALFTIGLFTICARGYNLFTGKVCYLFRNEIPSYLAQLGIIWLGNLVGTIILAYLERWAGMTTVVELAQGVVAKKAGNSLWHLFMLGLLCDIFIYIAVDGYKNNPYDIGKHLSLFFGVMIFILTGTEHSIADMYYWAVSGELLGNFGHSILCLVVISLGNAVGGVILPLCEDWFKKLQA